MTKTNGNMTSTNIRSGNTGGIRPHDTTANEWPGLTPELRQLLKKAEASGVSDAELLDFAINAYRSAHGDSVDAEKEGQAVHAWLEWSHERFAAAVRAPLTTPIVDFDRIHTAMEDIVHSQPKDWPTLVASYAAVHVPDHVLASMVLHAAHRAGLMTLVPHMVTWTRHDIQRWTGWPSDRAKAAFDGACRLWLTTPFE